MNPEVENALRILRFDKDAYVMSAIPSYVLRYTGANHEGYYGGGHDCPVGSKWTDIWGTEWHKEQEGVMGFPRGNPLAEPENLTRYVLPNPDDERICGKIYEAFEQYDGNTLLAGSHCDTLWEKSYMLAGMENMMVSFYTEPDFVRELLRKIMDFQLGIARHYLKCGVKIAYLADDLGTQNSLLLGRGIVEEFLVPEYRRLFALYKQHDVIMFFHSCGHVEPILDVFMELGVDVLNPIQATANNPERVRAATDGKMALCGGVSTDVVMKGPADAIDKAVADAIAILGKNGGYFCQPDQSMPFPPENMNAFHTAVNRHGGYDKR
jgi:uroporphyrinogen decarboxylase